MVVGLETVEIVEVVEKAEETVGGAAFLFDAEGSLEAQKLTITAEYDTRPSVAYVKGLIGFP